MPDLSQPNHLPNHRPDRQPPDKSWLPRQRRGTTPQMIGRYPDYDVLESAPQWDRATRELIEKRLRKGHRSLTFFEPSEHATFRAFCDVVTAQDCEPSIPVAEMVDDVLGLGELDGYQYADMPDDRDTWHIVVRGLDEVARERYGVDGFRRP